MTRFLLSAVGLALALAPVGVATLAYREGPVPAMTGGFGESTCRSCHFDNPPDAPRGSLRLEGLPERYEPGRTYRIQIDVRRPDIRRAGFELAVRFAEGPARGRQAGRLQPVDARTRTITSEDGLISYIQHNEAGSAAEDGRGHWTIAWTAPDDALGPVVFNVAANAANDDASPLGDYIYTVALGVGR